MKKMDIQGIKLENLSFSYDSSNPIFDGVSCEIPDNNIYQVTAKSGSGKSTFLRILAGLSLPSSGHLYYNGWETSQMSFEEFLPFRLNIGYSFDLGGLLSNKTLFENLALPLEYHNLYSTTEINERVREGLERFGLTDSAHSRPSSVAGSRRKAAIVARSLIMDPQLLLLDDPVVGMSSQNRKTLQSWLKEKFTSGRLKNVFIASEDQRFLSPLITAKIKIASQKIEFETQWERGAA